MASDKVKIPELKKIPYLDATKLAPNGLKCKFFLHACLLCDTKFYHCSKAKEHYEGNRHKQKVIGWKRANNFPVDEQPSAKKPRLEPEHRGSKNYRYCKVCKVTLTSEAQIAEHDIGKKHRKKVLEYRKAGNFDDCNPSFGIGSRCRASEAINRAHRDCELYVGKARQKEASLIKQIKTGCLTKAELLQSGEKVLETRFHLQALYSVQGKIKILTDEFQNDKGKVLGAVKSSGNEIIHAYMCTGTAEVKAIADLFVEFCSIPARPPVIRMEFCNEELEALFKNLNLAMPK